MILGIGTDIVEIPRIKEMIAKHGDAFLDRCFTDAEKALAAQREKAGGDIMRYASTYAAKEALAKALGTGIAKGVSFKDFEITRADNGAPIAKLSGAAQEHLKTLVPAGQKARIHLSLSDEASHALAFVVIEAV